MPDQQAFILSASVILLRQQRNSLEVLLLKKNAKITFGGSWVFPGGRTDSTDQYVDKQYNNLSYAAERKTVVRECQEETGLRINHNALLPVSLWKTPPTGNKRFATTFFVYDANNISQAVTIDQGEIVDAKWCTIEKALAEHNQRKISLAGPAFVILSQFLEMQTLHNIWQHYQDQKLALYAPRVQIVNDDKICLYHGDDGYHLLNQDKIYTDYEHLNHIENAHHQHRLYLYKDKAWSYINTTHKSR